MLVRLLLLLLTFAAPWAAIASSHWGLMVACNEVGVTKVVVVGFEAQPLHSASAASASNFRLIGVFIGGSIRWILPVSVLFVSSLWSNSQWMRSAHFAGEVCVKRIAWSDIRGSECVEGVAAGDYISRLKPPPPPPKRGAWMDVPVSTEAY